MGAALPLTDLSPLLPLLRERPFGLITDLDGTISVTAPTPDQAIVSPACRRYLEAIAARAELVAVVSGRPVEDARRLVGLEGIAYVGLHGFSLPVPPIWTEESIANYTTLARGVLDELRRAVSLPGILLEDKGPLIALHYRQAANAAAARQAILDAIGAVPSARRFAVHEGKMVVELRPPISAAHKGTVVRHLAVEHGLRSVFYMGDDVTDIDAFRVLQEATAFRGASAVVATEETLPDVLAAADYCVEGVAGAEALLGQMAAALRP